MPFTLSHPLYAVPLRKLAPALSATGLALGSMAPDMEYFIAMQPYRSTGHTFIGFLAMGLPLCTAFAYAFHRIIMPSLPVLLPPALGMNRFAALHQRAWSLRGISPFILFYISLYIGFLSHLFVDNWTHRLGYFVEKFPELSKLQLGQPIYFWLQQGLSVIGLGLPALYLAYRWLSWYSKDKGAAVPDNIQVKNSLIYSGAALITAGFLFAAKLAAAANPWLLNLWFVAPFSSVLFGLFAACLLISARRSNQTAAALCGLAGFAVIYLLFKKGGIGEHLSVQHAWYVYIWLFSLLVFTLSKTIGKPSGAQLPLSSEC
ncbi:DUF4184 family protein [Paenibacillus protaetiae]|uniref:DUF4184 family protein n=1 Tax=Paenibacillus protaetiae TaxID=2509456 RepID=A0A4P6EYF2_9BACL|nr:DUF4184 family protein [Paenibacillus protaetiae]QAY65677.1 DUF4184 family protein [Paenibacillus protaetiae]